MICTSLLDWPGLVPGLFFFQTKREGATDAAMGFPCCAGGVGQAGGLTDHRKVTLQLFLLAMASASCFAVGIVLAPFGLRHLSALSGAAVSVPTSAVLLLTASPLTVDWQHWDPHSAAIFAAGGLFYPAGVTLLNFAGNRRLGPNLTAAVGNVTPLFAIALAILFLGETLRLEQAGGIALLFLGLATIAADRLRSHPGASLWLLGLPLMAAALRGGAQPLVKAGLAGWPDAFAAATLAYAVSASVILLAYLLLGRGGPARTLLGILWFVAVGTANGTSLLLLYMALSLGAVSLVAPVFACYPLITYAINRLLLRQRDVTPRGILGIVLTVAGVVVLLAL